MVSASNRKLAYNILTGIGALTVIVTVGGIAIAVASAFANRPSYQYQVQRQKFYRSIT